MENTKSKIYCLGGLIMDDLVFRNLEPEGVELVHVKYIDHLRGETLQTYSKRLFRHLKLPENYQLLGVSFGGMIATEFYKIRKPEKLYLVSSINKKTQVSLRLRLAGFFKLHKIIPMVVSNVPPFLMCYLFGVKRKKDLNRIVRLLSPPNPKFLRWALDGILKWKNTVIPNAIRIHGTNDKILPINGVVDFPIKEGSHFLMVNRKDEISKILSGS